jgi:hypothetical protein
MIINLNRTKMKTNKHIALGLCALALSFASCEDYLDVNDNPNEAIDAPIENVMVSAMVSAMSAHSGEDARLAGMWTQQFTGVDRQYAALDVYNVTSADFDWGKHYYGIIEQSKIVARKATSNIDLGISKVLQAHSYGMLASIYGDIPFSEANQFEAGIDNPRFDGQVSVYAGVQGILDDAISNLQNSTGLTASADLFYDSDASKWLALAYTLKARFYMHTKEYPLALTAASNGITDVSGDWMTSHGTLYNQDMGMYFSFIQKNRVGYMIAQGAYLPSILDPASATSRGNTKTDETARFNDIYLDDPTDIGTLILNHTAMWAADASFALATASETHLIMAEVNARNNADLAAVDHLNAVRAILIAKYSTGTYDDYVLTDFTPITGVADKGKGSVSANLMYEIIEEKYASLVGQIEAFNDVRRTDNLIGLTPKGANGIPQRFFYPQDELNANVNAPAAVSLFIKTAVNN